VLGGGDGLSTGVAETDEVTGGGNSDVCWVVGTAGATVTGAFA